MVLLEGVQGQHQEALCGQAGLAAGELDSVHAEPAQEIRGSDQDAAHRAVGE